MPEQNIRSLWRIQGPIMSYQFLAENLREPLENRFNPLIYMEHEVQLFTQTVKKICTKNVLLS